MSGQIRILVLNPNSSKEMTEGVKNAVESTKPPAGHIFSYYTAPSPSPASINDADGLARSTQVVLEDLAAKSGPSNDGGDTGGLAGYDAVLIACYSVHPLVPTLAEHHRGRTVILGIFEASILSALALTSPYPRSRDSLGRCWGIVTTGKFWERHLEDGVRSFLNGSSGDGSCSAMANTTTATATAALSKFAGVYTTGLDAGDFHGGVDPEVVRAKLKEATRRLLASGRVGCVVMGCAGMAGLEEIIRSAIAEEYGEPKGPEDKVYVIDGVKAGAGLLAETVRNERLFSR